MALTKADELLVHQIPETFDTILQTDRSWTEKVWCTMHDNQGNIEVDVGFGRYHNRNVFDGFGGVCIGDTQWNVRASRELDLDPDSMSVGPLHYEIIEPLEAVRFRCDPNEYGIEYDLQLHGSLAPHLEERNFTRDHIRTAGNVLRYHQVGKVRGWVKVEGRTFTVEEGAWWGQRDHSWGLRGGVGGPEAGVQSSAAWARPGAGQPHPKRLLHWSPMQFPGWELFHFWIGSDLDNPTYFSGAVIRGDREERLTAMHSDLKFDAQTRRLLGGEVHFTHQDGSKLTVNVRPLAPGYYLAGGLYGGYRGNYHGTWRGPLLVEGEKWEDTTNPHALEIGQLRDLVCEFHCGADVGYGIFETIVTGAWPEFGLSLESSLF